jgi:hypothetical protein
MKAILSLAVASLVAMSFDAPAALAGVEFDQNVTPDAIFGSGNDNGAFTTARRRGVEIGLRGKLRFNAAGQPENTFNSNGDGTYSFNNIVAPTRPFPTPEWNFEWSINTDFAGTTGRKLGDLRYELGMDGDPGVGTSFLSFDPIYLGPNGCADHSLGTNLTGNGGGTEFVCPGDFAAYQAELGTANVAQNSWRFTFFPLGALAGFDPTVAGVYDIYLLARRPGGKVVARSDIRILVGLPAGLPKTKRDCRNGGWTGFGPLFQSEEACRDFVEKDSEREHDHDHDD